VKTVADVISFESEVNWRRMMLLIVCALPSEANILIKENGIKERSWLINGGSWMN
jgi:hypothetical protein